LESLPRFRSFDHVRTGLHDCIISHSDVIPSDEMPTATFNGYVFPPSVKINTSGGPIRWADPNFSFSYSFSIADSKVSIVCELGELTDIWINYCLEIISAHIHGAIDAIAFATGNGLVLLLEGCTFSSDGKMRHLRSGSPTLAGLCPLTPQEIIKVVESERRLMKPLSDLVSTLRNPLEAAVSVQRAMEGLSHLISEENDERAKRWENLRTNLNLSRQYLQYISDRSITQRHGHTGPVNLQSCAEIQKRGWSAMTRFIEFRRRGSARLPESEFPAL
jgi:hypothetical protein